MTTSITLAEFLARERLGPDDVFEHASTTTRFVDYFDPAEGPADEDGYNATWDLTSDRPVPYNPEEGI